MDKDLQSRYLYDAIIMFRKERTKNIRTSHPERCQGLDAPVVKRDFTNHLLFQ